MSETGSKAAGEFVGDGKPLVSSTTPEGGKIVLDQSSEGFCLRYHGSVVWRSYGPAPINAVLRVDVSGEAAKVERLRAEVAEGRLAEMEGIFKDDVDEASPEELRRGYHEYLRALGVGFDHGYNRVEPADVLRDLLESSEAIDRIISLIETIEDPNELYLIAEAAAEPINRVVVSEHDLASPIGEAAEARATAAEKALETANAEKAALVEALIMIADNDWCWEGGGSERRHRREHGLTAAKALGVPHHLSSGWPTPGVSETRAALTNSVSGKSSPDAR